MGGNMKFIVSGSASLHHAYKDFLGCQDAGCGGLWTYGNISWHIFLPF